MSLQVFLQARILGSERFLTRPHFEADNFLDLVGRCAWLGLLSEVLPRALLSEMKLSRMLLGASGGGHFLLVLTDESIEEAEQFLVRAAADLARLSEGTLSLVWSSTENLGAWPIVRKRLEDELERRISAPLGNGTETGGRFTPFQEEGGGSFRQYFETLGKQIATAREIGWSAEEPARLHCDAGSLRWVLADQASADGEAISFPRRYVLDDRQGMVRPEAMAEAAQGAKRWAVLRGDVDGFDLRLKRTDSVEEYIHLSVLLKEFFAGELSLLCSLPEFWRKASILYRGPDDFAVIGAWDALVALARELERVFEKFVAQNLGGLAGIEGKSISMALAIAPESDAAPTSLFEQAGAQLDAAKANEIGTFHLFGRTLEWKRLADAEELKKGLVRLVSEFNYSASYIHDLASVYREAYSAQATKRAKAIPVERPWRMHMRLSRIIPATRQRDLQQLRNSVISSLIGTNTANAKLRPSGRVGLEWARLATENE